MRIYIGYDDREKLAYDVCKSSALRHCRNKKAEIIPLKHRDLRLQGLFKRPWHTRAEDGIRVDLIDGMPFSTEFSHTRFLVPLLNGYKGFALFMDCDMIFRCDPKKLFEMADPKCAVQVVKHRHEPLEKTKMDNQEQHRYYRKNWSSFVLWNCEHPANKFLTSERVSFATGRDLHAFSWLNETQIGHLGFDWNWIEGVSPVIEDPKVIHYTNGGPWFDECQQVMFADEWYDEKRKMEEDL